ncbi:hypothetical protein HDU79_012029 [Rhizoclosmatium sp. JEL0117]|nr:hypothetical protein HDU79_012029 [Rhizoclosmatium sp. JEL0117]
MDDILFTVFKSAAGPTQNIIRGIDALKAHYLGYPDANNISRVSKDEQIARLTKALAATHMKPPTRTKDLTKLFAIGFPLGTTAEQLLDVFHGSTGVDFAKSGNGKLIAFVQYESAAAAT